MKLYVQPHPEYMLVRSDGRLSVIQPPKPQATQSVGISAVGCAGARQLPNAAELDSAAQAGAAVPTSTSAPEHLEQKPAASGSAAEVREKITAMIRQNLPELTKAYNEA